MNVNIQRSSRFSICHHALTLATLLLALPKCSSVSPGYPVILIPGDGGSQLEAKLNKTSVPHIWCEKHTSTYDNIWLNIEELLPEAIDCFVDNMKLFYDRKTHTTYSLGIDIRTTGFGDTMSVEWLDPSYWSHYSTAIAYFQPIVQALVEHGYKRNMSVRGAPFDFRKAPNELGHYYDKFKSLIVETYLMNNKTRVALLAHSMGNPVALYFLNQQSQEWKDQYIECFLTLAGVWGGALKPLRLMSSGDGLGVYIVNPLSVRPEQRAMPSTAFLMPSDKFWKPHEILVQTDKRNYTVASYKEFFSDLDYIDGFHMWQDTHRLIYNLTPPAVAVHCIHGSGIGTPEKFVFPANGFPDTYPKAIMGDGDGTVNMRSLEGCVRWTNEQTAPVKHLVIPKAEHMGILKDKSVIDYVLKTVIPSQSVVNLN